MFEALRQLNIWTMLLRMVLAVVFGGFIGLNREQKKMPAGLRTYMLVCLGACLTSLLAVYEYNYLAATAAAAVGVKTDVARFPAQVISGIGFLGAGTIMLTEGNRVTGVTTAACLWASACMGIAIGFGFYECAIAGWILIVLVIRVLPFWQRKLRQYAEGRDINA